MKQNLLWLLVALGLVAVIAVLSSRAPPNEDVPKPGLNISGVSLGMPIEEVKSLATQVEVNPQGPVWEIKLEEPTGRQTRVYLRNKAFAVFGYNLFRAEERLLVEGDSRAQVVERLGEPSQSVSMRRDVVHLVYPQYDLRVSLVAGKVQEIVLEKPGGPDALQASPNSYEQCSENLTRTMEDFQARYGPDGVVPMSAINTASLLYPCPSAGKPTISATGTGGADGVSMTDLTLFCRGENHSEFEAPEHFPELHSVRGLSTY